MTTDNTDREELELLPCPFCGRKAIVEEFRDGDDPQPLFVATCEVCPAKTYDQFSSQEAIRIWNSRAPQGDDSEQLADSRGNYTDGFRDGWKAHFDASPAVAAPQGDVFTAYNQAVEDAKAAIRAESQGGGYWAATFINAIARKCSPHVYVNSLSPVAPSLIPEQEGILEGRRRAYTEVEAERIKRWAATPATATAAERLKQTIERVIHEHNLSRTHAPRYCCPEDEAVYDRLLTRRLVDELSSATPSAVPVEEQERPLKVFYPGFAAGEPATDEAAAAIDEEDD